MHRASIAPILLSAGAATGLLACFGFGESDYIPDTTDEVTVAAKPPPPISGGTLLVTREGDTAVAADPDRDRVWVADLPSRTLTAEIVLEEGDEPGRVAEGEGGLVYVALRRGGAVVTIDLASNSQVDRRPVCAAPRGMAYDMGKGVLHVACAGGELVTLPAVGAQPVRTVKLDRDLRDVVVDGDRVLVSRFRSAELLVIGSDGIVEIGPDGREKRYTPPVLSAFGTTQQPFEPAVAWRTVALPGGGAAMVHQRGAAVLIPIIPPSTYTSVSSGCGSDIVDTTVTLFRSGAPDQPSPSAFANQSIAALLPVDVAISPFEDNMAIVSAGADMVFLANQTQIQHPSQYGSCAQVSAVPVQAPIAVAFTKAGNLVVQSREPARLFLPNDGTTIDLPGQSVLDTGHEIFHRSPNGFAPLACASCHPEGREDGRTWSFDPIGQRRTQAIAGGISSTAPLHWDGDMDSVGAIMEEVFVHRMGGQSMGARRERLVARWLDALPLLPSSPASDPSAVERGQVLFNDATVGCNGCHSGEKLTNNQTVDVGTGQAFQVPALIGLADRAPYMHDGCAKTLHDRFGACGGGDKHGKTSHLSEAQIDDLVAYLETL